MNFQSIANSHNNSISKKELQDIINRGENIKQLSYLEEEDINNELKQLKKLRDLYLGELKFKIDLSTLTNLEGLTFILSEYEIDVSNLTNLTHLHVGFYNKPLDITLLTNLEIMSFNAPYRHELNFENKPNLRTVGIGSAERYHMV